MNNILPLVEFTIDPKKKNAGVKAISIVDEPAIESNFQLFTKDSLERYKFADETKQMILGLALVPNKKIYRVDKNKNEYNGFFSAPTIELIRNKFMQEKNTDQVNLQHDDKEYVNGVYLVETYIVQSPDQQKLLLSKGIDAPIGSWAVQYHVDSPELFNEIKLGGYQGFSVEAFLDNQLVVQIPTIMNKENFKDGRIAETGQQISYGKVGAPVTAVVDIKAGGNQSVSSLSDGQYTLDDGTIIAVKGGVLFEIEPKKEGEADYKVPTPDQIKEQQQAIVAKENQTQTLLMEKQNLEHDAANAYEPTGSKPKEYKPVAPPAAQTMENDSVPAGAANNGDGLKVDPVKSIGQVPAKKKPGFKKLKTSRMKKLADQTVTEVPATPVHSSESKPSVPANVGPQATITKVPATPVKLSKETWAKMSRYERLKFALKIGEVKECKLAVDPNAELPTDKMPEGKMPEAPVAPKEPVNDATTKEVKAALPPEAPVAPATPAPGLPTDIVEEPETPEEKSAEGEEELPVTDMDKSVNELVMGKGDGQYNIMVVIENGVITEAGIEMEISQSLAFAKADDKLAKENLELKEKLAKAEAKLVQPIAKPTFGAAPVKQAFSKEELSKMTPYERLATQKGLRIITAK